MLYHSLRFSSFFFSMTPRPPTSTLFPYTTLFRSYEHQRHGERRGRGRDDHERQRRDAERLRECRDDGGARSEEHTSELQSPYDLVCRLLLEKKKKKNKKHTHTTTKHNTRTYDTKP